MKLFMDVWKQNLLEYSTICHHFDKSSLFHVRFGVRKRTHNMQTAGLCDRQIGGMHNFLFFPSFSEIATWNRLDNYTVHAFNKYMVCRAYCVPVVRVLHSVCPSHTNKNILLATICIGWTKSIWRCFIFMQYFFALSLCVCVCLLKTPNSLNKQSIGIK